MMPRLTLLLALSTSAVVGQPQKAPPPKPPQIDPWLVKLARFLGVSTTPPTILRGSETVQAGQIWIGSVDRSVPSRLLASEPIYQAPVFSSDGTGLYVLRREAVVRIAIENGSVVDVISLPDAVKLVGATQEAPEELLLVRRRGNRYSAWTLTIATGRLTEVRGIETGSPAMYALLDNQRFYRSGRIYTTPVAVVDIAGRTEHENVFYANQSNDPLQITKCTDADCTDPSISPNGTAFVFIKHP